MKTATLPGVDRTLVDAALVMDKIAINYMVEMTPNEAMLFCGLAEGGNAATSDNLQALIKRINKRIPRCNYGPDNVNTGTYLHNFEVGNEGSRVLYVTFMKGSKEFPSDRHLENLAEDLTIYGKASEADEVHDTSTEHRFRFRFWWD
jgi:hypothetical protein